MSGENKGKQKQQGNEFRIMFEGKDSQWS